MEKKFIELTVNCPVELTDFEGKAYQGYLVYTKDCKTGYLVLPFDWRKDIYFFKASHIKSIRLLRNGAVIGGGKREWTTSNS